MAQTTFNASAEPATLLALTQTTSITVTDPRILRRHLADPDFPVVVSFPRTGSHWLRMVMELYFERPSLVRVFYFPQRTDYLTLHVHDQPGGLPDGLGENVERANVIYLYRNPVHTIYSQLRFYGESTDDVERIRYWADAYGRHLDKWLHTERFTTRKTVLTYEGMRRDLAAEFRKLTDHFAVPLDERKLRLVAQRVNKAELHRLVGAERPEVVNLGSSYDRSRESFERTASDAVWDALLAGRPHLTCHFGHLAETNA